MRGLFAAIGFLTRIPMPARVFVGASSPSAQLAWYPAVGLLIGGLLWCLGWLLSGAEPMLAAGLLLVAWVARLLCAFLLVGLAVRFKLGAVLIG